MILYYNNNLKPNAQQLRKNLTSAEKLLWYRLRRKQLLKVQFYRQKPLGRYIVDFYAPSVKLVIEIDGGQHFEKEQMKRDKERDLFMENLGVQVLRFDNLQVMRGIEDVMGVIWERVRVRQRK